MKLSAIVFPALVLKTAAALSQQQKYDGVKASFFECLGTNSSLATVKMYADGVIVVEPSTDRTFDFEGGDEAVHTCWQKAQDGTVIALASLPAAYGYEKDGEDLAGHPDGPAGIQGVSISMYQKNHFGKRNHPTGLMFSSWNEKDCKWSRDLLFNQLVLDNSCKTYMEDYEAPLMHISHPGPCTPPVIVTFYSGQKCEEHRVYYMIGPSSSYCVTRPSMLFSASINVDCNCCDALINCLSCRAM